MASLSAWSQRRALELAVLLYLSTNGPTQWCALYTHFKQEKLSDTACSLCDLALMKYIATNEDGIAAITERGQRHLEQSKSDH
jgi:hypothetical protein